MEDQRWNLAEPPKKRKSSIIFIRFFGSVFTSRTGPLRVVMFSSSSDVSLVSTLVSAPYSGCMEVSVNGKNLDLDRAVHKHNDIRSHSCPLLDSHH